MTEGCRGYIFSRPFFGERVPQHVQNLVIRDYCARRGLAYRLSATEYAMPGCWMMLEGVLEELPRLDGIVLYSLFQLPERDAARQAVYRRVLAAGAGLHGAVEDFAVHSADDVRRVEDLWLVRRFLARTEQES